MENFVGSWQRDCLFRSLTITVPVETSLGCFPLPIGFLLILKKGGEENCDSLNLASRGFGRLESSSRPSPIPSLGATTSCALLLLYYLFPIIGSLLIRS